MVLQLHGLLDKHSKNKIRMQLSGFPGKLLLRWGTVSGKHLKEFRGEEGQRRANV